MKNRFIAAACITTLCFSLVLAGCGKEKTQYEEILLSEEMAEIAEGSVSASTRFYTVDGNALTDTRITVYNNGTDIYSGAVDENGFLLDTTLPSNTELEYKLTNSAGDEIASATVKYILSNVSTSFKVTPAKEDGDIITVELPAAKSQLSLAIYLDENGSFVIANATQYNAAYFTTGDALEGTLEDEGSAEGEGSEEGSEEDTNE